MKKKRLWILIIGLASAVGLVTGGILAWLTDTKTTPTQTFTVGDVTYDWTAGAFVTGPVVPGQNVIATPYNLTKTSNVDSELRLEITITYGASIDATSLVVYTLDSNWDLETDDYYYYRAVAEVAGKYPIAPSTNVNVITGLSLDGGLVGNDFSGVEFTVTITFYAKQSNYVTWAQLGSINFTTGLA